MVVRSRFDLYHHRLQKEKYIVHYCGYYTTKKSIISEEDFQLTANWKSLFRTSAAFLQRAKQIRTSRMEMDGFQVDCNARVKNVMKMDRSLKRSDRQLKSS